MVACYSLLAIFLTQPPTTVRDISPIWALSGVLKADEFGSKSDKEEDEMDVDEDPPLPLARRTTTLVPNSELEGAPLLLVLTEKYA